MIVWLIQIKLGILKLMEERVRSNIDALSPLLKLVKEREQLFFELLSFVHKNIQCSSNDLDTTTIFNHFLPPLKFTHSSLRDRQQLLLEQLRDTLEEGVMESASNQILRLSSRIIEILQASLARVRKGIFDEGGRSGRDLARFKIALHKILKKKPFFINEFAASVIGFTTPKFTRQLAKIEKYIEKVSQGQDIFLKQLYAKASDAEVSPEEKHEKKESTHSPSKKPYPKLQVEGHSKGEREEKKSLKRPLRTSVKKRQKLPSTRPKPRDNSDSEQEKPNKEQAANKLAGFYKILEISKKEFLEDYIFKETQTQKRKAELLHKLLQRNKGINTQIKSYVKKSCVNLPVPIIVMPPPNNRSSGDQHSQILVSKSSHKAGFIISKRRGSIHLDATPTAEKQSDPQLELDLSSAMKTHSQPRKLSRGSKRSEKSKEKSNKIFVVKQPMVFEDEMIPQAQIHQPQWFHTPHSVKRHENIRMKRKNNPSPLQNSHLPQNFKYPI